MERLRQKVAVVTGGARGIGASFCEAMAAAGAKVVVADVLDGGTVVGRIEKAQGKAIYCKTDVTSQASVKAMVVDTLRAFGTIDVLVNNAALFANLHRKPFLEIDGDEWDTVMAVNVRGPFECAKAVAPVMIAKKNGKIVNMASGTVFKGQTGLMHYVSSKGAVVAMTRCLAREFGPHNICVNAIAPSLTMSEAVAESPDYTGPNSEATVKSRAFQRAQAPADLIGTLLYLASDDSDFVTGQTIAVDGGSVMH